MRIYASRTCRTALNYGSDDIIVNKLVRVINVLTRVYAAFSDYVAMHIFLYNANYISQIKITRKCIMKEFNMLNLFQILLIKFIMYMYVYTLKIQQTFSSKIFSSFIQIKI